MRGDARTSFLCSNMKLQGDWLNPIMLKLMIRLRRTRLTIMRLMSMVVFCALILGCIIEMRRIKRAQTFFGQMAANYAQREKLERDTIAFYLDQALVNKRMAESQSESIEHQASRAGRHLGEFGDGLLQSKVRLYESYLDSGRRNLIQVREARIKADRFAILKTALRRGCELSVASICAQSAGCSSSRKRRQGRFK